MRKMKVNRPGRERKVVAVSEAFRAIFWPTPGFQRRTFVSSGFSTERTLFLHPQYPTAGVKYGHPDDLEY